MWPAIWMLPTESVYGAWPASGEIDLAESRGNNYTYKYGGNQVASSALHWGPQPGQDAVSLSKLYVNQLSAMLRGLSFVPTMS